jgi:hypothetical protein
VLRVAVTLPAQPGEVGEYLADVTALEAAGAYAVWVEDTGPDPWVVLGALAAITHRLVLGCLITSPAEWPATTLARAARTLQTLSRGRIVVGLPREGLLEDQLDALRAADVRIFGSDFVAGEEAWVSTPAPLDRDAWNDALAACEAAGATGVIVPWTDRLIDLLRNPEPDDRSDLLISTG